MRRRPLLIAVGLAVLVGIVARVTGHAEQVLAVVAPLEDVFARLIRLVIFPLVFLALASAVLSFGNSRAAGLFGLKTLLVVLTTSFVSVTFAVTVGLLAQQGFSTSTPSIANHQSQIANSFSSFIPDSIFRPFVDGSLGQMLVIGFVAALVVLHLGKSSNRRIVESTSQLRDLFGQLARLAFVLVPPGVFCVLCTRIVGTTSLSFGSCWKFVAVVYFCFAVHVFVFDTLLVYVFRGVRPHEFLKISAPVVLLALTTCSSAVTYPLVRRKVRELGVSTRESEVVSSLGLTLNSDGSLMSSGLAVIGLAIGGEQPLGFGQICLLISTLVLVSIFLEDGMPGGNVVLLGFVLSVVGLPADSVVLLTGINLLLDPGCTVVNAVGDLAVATVLTEKKERGP